jgi:prepilin-type N-terminal cleavage/methylation domain-containing protein
MSIPGHGRRQGMNDVSRWRGFTLIEVLVVVAIIALLVAVLLPSLARAREQAKMLMCSGHLKEFSKALGMYTMEYKDKLPGPMHPAIMTDTANTNPFQKTFYLPAMLRKYFSENSRGTGSLTDALARCPSFPVADNQFGSIWGTGPNAFNYCLNTWTNTKPDNYYFGFTHAGINDYSTWMTTYGNTSDRLDVYGPKKLGRIKQPAKEWAIADAFRRPYAAEDAGLNAGLPRGSWPREDVSDSNSGNPLPRSPFHMESGYLIGGVAPAYKGRTVTLYFDMHVEAQRGFGRFVFNRDEF